MTTEGSYYNNTPMLYTAIFTAVNNDNFHLTFFLYCSYFCSKHKLWVLNEAVLSSTQNLCFREKIRKSIPM